MSAAVTHFRSAADRGYVPGQAVLGLRRRELWVRAALTKDVDDRRSVENLLRMRFRIL